MKINVEKTLFEEMVKSIEEKNQKELEYIIAKQETERIRAAYLGYKREKVCEDCCYGETLDNIFLKENRIYCGTQDYVDFFETIISTLGIKDELKYEVEDVDGELEIVIGGNV